MESIATTTSNYQQHARQHQQNVHDTISVPPPISPCLPAISIAQLPEAELKFQTACKQLIILNNAIREMNVRYTRAIANNQRSFRYMLRLRLCTMEGLRNMFHEYATDLADRLDALERSAGMTTDEMIQQHQGAGEGERIEDRHQTRLSDTEVEMDED